MARAMNAHECMFTRLLTRLSARWHAWIDVCESLLQEKTNGAIRSQFFVCHIMSRSYRRHACGTSMTLIIHISEPRRVSLDDILDETSCGRGDVFYYSYHL